MESKTYTTKSGNSVVAEMVEVPGGITIVAKWGTPASPQDKEEIEPILMAWAEEWAKEHGREMEDAKIGAGRSVGEALLDIMGQSKADEPSIFIGECGCGSPTCGTISFGIQNADKIEKHMDGVVAPNVVGIRSVQAPRVMRIVESMLAASLRNMPDLVLEGDLDTLMRRVKEQVREGREKSTPAAEVIH